MEFGKLNDISKIDFQLPEDRCENARILRGGSVDKKSPAKIYIGCTGWSMKEWLGWVYPKGCPSKDYGYYYTRQFNTIEFNTTHYRIPSVSDVEKWRNLAPDDFRYAPKMLQTVSHAKNLGYGTGLTRQFCEAIQGLEEKLGICFMQMPSHFHYPDLGIFEQYIARFPKTIPLAVEIRHPTWFDTPQYFDTFFSLLENYGVTTVLTDVAGRRDVLHMRLTSPTVLIRFVGNDLHTSDYTRIDAWVERLKTWLAMGLQEAYFFTHEPDNLKAPQLARYLYDSLKSQTNAILRGPIFESEKTEKQFRLF
jgi:uncharacterized protein YecE (DUF72 family)